MTMQQKRIMEDTEGRAICGFRKRMMSMSGAAAQITSFGLTPLMVPSPDYITLMNIVWFIPAALGSLLCMCKVNILKLTMTSFTDMTLFVLYNYL